MELNGRQQSQFQQALLSAFPSKAKLTQMVSFELDWHLEAIAGGQNLSEIVFALIQHAESEGATSKLLTAARNRNPGNPTLRNFAQSLSQPPKVVTPSSQSDDVSLGQVNNGGTNFQTQATGNSQVNQANTINIYNNPASPTAPASSASTKTILFLASNPKDTGRLRLDQERREIDESLRRSQKRDQFTLESKGAIRPRDFRRHLLDHNPQIIHFSGHGEAATDLEPAGLYFEDEIGNAKLISTDQLAATFELFAEQIECVLLNACHSRDQAEAIAQNIPYVIGMKRPISDKAAIEFATSFYDAIGSGRDIPFAFKLACSQLVDFGEQNTPELLKRP